MHVLTQRETRERLFKCPKSLKNKRSPRAPYKNGEFGDYRCFFCLLHEVLCFKSKYRAQTISLIWIEDQFAVISSVLSQEMRKVYGAMSLSYEQNQPKRCKMHSILRTCGIVSYAGESFGVLRLETSPQTSFSNGNLIEQYLRFPKIYLVLIPYTSPLVSEDTGTASELTWSNMIYCHPALYACYQLSYLYYLIFN